MFETIDGGRLQEAAEAKSDEEMLLHIRGKDCVAAEVRYRLQKSFRQLSFHMPFARSKREIVIAEMLTSGELAERREIVENYDDDLREEAVMNRM